MCVRDRCRRKHDDLVVHLQYRKRVAELNAARLCGVEGCLARHVVQCSLCEGKFCEGHLAQRRYAFDDGWARAERWVSVCPRCWERRKIWRGR